MKTFSEFQEGVASLTLKGGSKLIPALMTGIGAAGTIMQSKKVIDPMDFGKSKRSEEEKDYARNRRKSAGLGKKKINVQGRNQKMQGGFSKGIKNEKEVKDTKEKTTSSKGFGEEYYDWRSTLDEKCWKGYEKKGMKTMFGKRYPNCVKKSKKKK